MGSLPKFIASLCTGNCARWVPEIETFVHILWATHKQNFIRMWQGHSKPNVHREWAYIAISEASERNSDVS